MALGIYWGLWSQLSQPGFSAFISKLWAGHHAFLTVIAARLTIVNLALNTLGLRRLVGPLLGISLPLNFLTTLLFWGLFMIDPGLVLHSRKASIPIGINLATHVLPLVASFWLWHSVRLKRNYSSILVLFTLTLVYFGLLHCLHEKDGRWLYPILGILAFHWRALLAFEGFIVMLATYYFISYKEPMPPRKIQRSK